MSEAYKGRAARHGQQEHIGTADYTRKLAAVQSLQNVVATDKENYGFDYQSSRTERQRDLHTIDIFRER